ncbi:MFS transporter [Brachybacterium sp.]|uniref:MFS transporter n=1 Tax=Brachybacterium sp. TaxID=1891286 RepID=UPI002ED5E5E2
MSISTDPHIDRGKRAPAGRGAWGLAAAGLSLIAVCYGLARFSYGLFVPIFREQFALGGATAGAIASGSYAAYCIAIVLAMLLTPRWGGRSVAVAAGLVATAGTLVVALAPNAAVLAAGVIIAGASTGVASPPLAHAVTRAVPGPRRDRVQTVINAGTGVGVAVAGPVALLTHEHWRLAWLAFAALCALVTLWALRSVPGPRVEVREAEGPTSLPRPLLPLGSGRLISAALLMGASSAAIWTFGRDLLVTEGGMSGQASTLGWIVLGIFGVLGAGAGDLAQRIGLRAGWGAGMLALALSTSLLAAWPGIIGPAWAALAGFGAAYIALTGFLLLWGTAVHARHPALGVGTAFLMVALGQALAAPVIGALGVAGHDVVDTA